MELTIYNAYCREERLTEDQLFSRISELTSWQTRIGKLFNLVECEKRSASEVSAYRAFETYTCFLLDEAQQILQAKLATRLQELPIEQIEQTLKQWEDDPKFASVYNRAKLTSRELSLREILDERAALAPYMEIQATSAFGLDEGSEFWPVLTPESLTIGGRLPEFSGFWVVEAAGSPTAEDSDSKGAPVSESTTLSPAHSSLPSHSKNVRKPIEEWTPYNKMIAFTLINLGPGFHDTARVASHISATNPALRETLKDAVREYENSEARMEQVRLNKGKRPNLMLNTILRLKVNGQLKRRFEKSVSNVRAGLKQLGVAGALPLSVQSTDVHGVGLEVAEI